MLIAKFDVLFTCYCNNKIRNSQNVTNFQEHHTHFESHRNVNADERLRLKPNDIRPNSHRILNRTNLSNDCLLKIIQASEKGYDDRHRRAYYMLTVLILALSLSLYHRVPPDPDVTARLAASRRVAPLT